MTIRELRDLLYNIDNQDMSVFELRRKLYDSPEDQDQDFEDYNTTIEEIINK